MRCPYCGYDKIQPNFNFCPKCKRSLKEQNETKQVKEYNEHHAQEKGFINRAFSRWTYERAMADPYAYASWAYRNPNDNRVFLERWNRDGNDLSTIRRAISEANRARQENPTVDCSDVDTTKQNIINENVGEVFDITGGIDVRFGDNITSLRGHIVPPMDEKIKVEALSLPIIEEKRLEAIKELKMQQKLLTDIMKLKNEQ